MYAIERCMWRCDFQGCKGYITAYAVIRMLLDSFLKQFSAKHWIIFVITLDHLISDPVIKACLCIHSKFEKTAHHG